MNVNEETMKVEASGTLLNGTEGEDRPLTEAELAPWEELVEAYPAIDSPEKLPEGVAEAIEAGKSPLVAMHEAEIRRLNAVIADYERRENAAKSAGSVTGTGAPAADPVLEILLAE